VLVLVPVLVLALLLELVLVLVLIGASGVEIIFYTFDVSGVELVCLFGFCCSCIRRRII
jgi:hypothetical protein